MGSILEGTVVEGMLDKPHVAFCSVANEWWHVFWYKSLALVPWLKDLCLSLSSVGIENLVGFGTVGNTWFLYKWWVWVAWSAVIMTSRCTMDEMQP